MGPAAERRKKKRGIMGKKGRNAGSQLLYRRREESRGVGQKMENCKEKFAEGG